MSMERFLRIGYTAVQILIHALTLGIFWLICFALEIHRNANSILLIYACLQLILKEWKLAKFEASRHLGVLIKGVDYKDIK